MGILVDTVRIYNFRSLRNVEVTLSPVTVLVGMSTETLAIASPAGYRCFTEVEDFRRYVERDSLAVEAM